MSEALLFAEKNTHCYVYFIYYLELVAIKSWKGFIMMIFIYIANQPKIFMLFD